MEVAGKPCRIYVEEAGEGIPLVCLHTAGSGRYANTAIFFATKPLRTTIGSSHLHGTANRIRQSAFAKRNISSTDLYKETVMAFCRAYELVDPVVMGCSMGGRVVLHLALEQADYFKRVIALEGADKLDAYYDLDWLHRPDVHGGEVASAFVSAQVAPAKPVFQHRWETLWHYMQVWPGIFKGDLYFYWHDGDFDDRSPLIDTEKCPVYLLSGEYDLGARLSERKRRLPGSKAQADSDGRHRALRMSENPELFEVSSFLCWTRSVANDNKCLIYGMLTAVL